MTCQKTVDACGSKTRPEPTLGVDVVTGLELRSEFTRLAEKEDVTVVLTSHGMDMS